MHTVHMCTHMNRDVMDLSMLRHVYAVLESEGELKMVEAKLNVMQTVFLAIQTSLSLGEDILEKGKQIFQTLFSRHFTDTLEVNY